MANVAIITGRVCSKPHVNGNNAVHFKIKTKIGYDKKNKKDKIAYVPVVVFDLTDPQIALITPGQQVCVTGQVQEFRFPNKEKKPTYKTEVVVNRFNLEFLDLNDNQSVQGNNHQEDDQQDTDQNDSSQS